MSNDALYYSETQVCQLVITYYQFAKIFVFEQSISSVIYSYKNWKM